MNLKHKQDLERILSSIDRRGYKAYKDLEGRYDSGLYELYIDHVQGDPFAAPSRVRVRISQREAEFPRDTYTSKSRNVGLCDYLTRAFAVQARRRARGNRGTGNSGRIEIDRPGQEIIERSSVRVTSEYVEARFMIGLPAYGRTVSARDAREMLFAELPSIVEASLLFRSLDSAELYPHIQCNEDADHLREALTERNLVAFVATGSILPRASGVEDIPLDRNKAVPFASPPELEVAVQLPNYGEVKGMGIPKGVTLIVGGGYHGKSTLLRAIEMGIYDHIPGDGRERVVSHADCVKIRAEDGRRVEKVDISPFINHLPFGQDTLQFSSEEASGSTSQAANIIEALEVGASVLLIDEDTSATNFMIRDHRMQELVAKAKEPITPFIDKVRLLYKDYGVSTIMVIGGSGDYFDVADTVIMMDEYLPHDVTHQALAIASKYRAERKPEGGTHFGTVSPRIPLEESFDPRRGKRDVKITVKGRHTIVFGKQAIDLSAVEQVAHTGQTRAIADAILYAKQRYMNGGRTLREILTSVMEEIKTEGLELLGRYPTGDYVLPRRFELAAAMNRLRTMRVRQGALRQ